MNRNLILIMLLIIPMASMQAQDKKLKFGKIDMADLQMTVYPGDSSASAVVLADQGFSTLKYDQEGGFYLHHTRHKRVKILTKEGYDQADVSILLYENGGSKEEIGSLKAATYNLEDGKMKTTKVGRKSMFNEKYNDNYTYQKFTFPDVVEGSVIEYSYTLMSDFIFNLQDWAFQDEIPTVWSEYIVEIPEYFNYERFAQGFHAMSINKSEPKRDQIVFRTKSRSGGNVTRTSYSEDRLDYTKTVHHWLAEDVPAFKEEPYMASTKNFISKINFELASTQFPGSPIKRYMGTWNDVNNTFLNNQDFGQVAAGSGFLKERVESLVSGASSDQEKILAIIDNVKSSVSWNGQYRKYASSSLRDILKKGEGSSSDINLLLTNMLRKAGYDADPVLISTRNNGFVRERFALSSQFNYVVSAVDLPEGTLLLDATDNTLPGNLLPQRCLNGRGWRVSASKPGWVNITSGGRESVLVSANVELTEEGLIKGKTKLVYSDYAAKRMRSDYFKEEEKFEESLSGQKGWKVNELTTAGMDDLSKAVVLNADIETGVGVEMLGDLIYLNPFVTERIDENPFKLESRQFPVDFVSPVRNSYMLTLKVPEGFEIEEMPKSEVVALPEGAGKFAYYLQQADGVISFRCTLIINKRLFSGVEYPYLRQFFSKIVEKEGEQIVLKRKTE